MSWHYAQEAAEESSEECYAVTLLLELLKSKSILEKSSSNGSETDCSTSSQSGMTLQHSHSIIPKRESISIHCGPCANTLSSQLDSHVKTSALPEKEKELKREQDPASGLKLLGSLGRYDPHTSSLRTHQGSLFSEELELLQTLPEWGTMQDGELSELMPPAQITGAKESGLLPTTLARMWKNRKWYNRKNPMGNLDELPAVCPQKYGHLSGKQISLEWLEHHMILPLGWTDLKPLEMDKFLQWYRSHGRS